MLSRIFLRYVDRFGCDYHRLSATDLQCLFIIIDSMGGNCQYEIFKELQSSPGFMFDSGFAAEGCGIALSGDDQEVSVTGLAFVSPVLNGKE